MFDGFSAPISDAVGVRPQGDEAAATGDALAGVVGPVLHHLFGRDVERHRSVAAARSAPERHRLAMRRSRRRDERLEPACVAGERSGGGGGRRRFRSAARSSKPSARDGGARPGRCPRQQVRAAAWRSRRRRPASSARSARSSDSASESRPSRPVADLDHRAGVEAAGAGRQRSRAPRSARR